MLPDVSSFALRFAVKIKSIYGSTEVSAPHSMDWNDLDWQLCGRLADQLNEAWIVDANGEVVLIGIVGEFVIRCGGALAPHVGLLAMPGMDREGLIQPVALLGRCHDSHDVQSRRSLLPCRPHE